jgi:hypothetical protein
MRTFKYEVWSGKRMLGYHIASTSLVGKGATFYDWDKGKLFEVQIKAIYKQNKDGVSWIGKIVLDVSRKSNRQIKFVIGTEV